MRKQSEFTDIVCANCGYVYGDVVKILNEKPEERAGCPKCKSKAIDIKVEVRDEVTVYESIKYQFKKTGSKKASTEGKSGDEFHTGKGEWRQIERRIDRVNNVYDEIITDSDGKVIREVHEPLTDHVGRGTARKKRKGS